MENVFRKFAKSGQSSQQPKPTPNPKPSGGGMSSNETISKGVGGGAIKK